MAVISNSGYIAADVEIPVRQVAGVPVNGAAGTYFGHAKPGTLLVDTTNAILYINTNTLASPTWSAVGNVAPAELTALLAAIPTVAVADVASVNAINPANAAYTLADQTKLAAVANETKAQLNALLAQLRTAGIIAP